MKKLIFIFLIALSSCKKETNNSNTIDNLFTETKDNVQINEPILLSFGDNTTAQTIVWKCEPNNGVTINQVGAYTTTTFANAVVLSPNDNKTGSLICTLSFVSVNKLSIVLLLFVSFLQDDNAIRNINISFFIFVIFYFTQRR